MADETMPRPPLRHVLTWPDGDDEPRVTDHGKLWEGDVERIRRLEAEVARLTEELADARGEINRHHVDFARWERMAADGVRARAEVTRLLEVLADVAKERDAAKGEAARHYITAQEWRSRAGEESP